MLVYFLQLTTKATNSRANIFKTYEKFYKIKGKIKLQICMYVCFLMS